MMEKTLAKLPPIIQKIVIVLLTLLIIAVAALFVIKKVTVSKMDNITLNNQTELITVEPGMSFHRFSKYLVNRKILADRFWLRTYVRFVPEMSKIKTGTYQVLPNTTLRELLNDVVLGKEHQFSITFIEGTSIKQWLELLARTEYIQHELPSSLTEGSHNLFSVSYVDNEQKMNSLRMVAQQLSVINENPEGYFYPDTYAYSAGDSDIEILRRAHHKMLQELDKLWAERDTSLPYKNKHEALTMASIIEKESGKYAEHDIIASVFVNRLHKKMRLQTDPTVIYGLGENYFGDITFKHLRDKTAYNTRKIKGFPPTPIAMPGKNALVAAFHPANTHFLYFVSNGQGKHIFSENLADHNAAVNKYQRKTK